MSCNNPLFRLKVGKSLYKALPMRYKKRCKGDLEEDKCGIIMDSRERDLLADCYGIMDDYFQQIPCGKCLGCLNDYSATWTTRAMLEASLYKYNYFITLTYDDEHLPTKAIINPLTGETRSVACLVKEDFSAFFKRLRTSQSDRGYPSPRFLACGEYGDMYKRCHFHFLGFNLYIDDLQLFYWKGQNGFHFDYQVGDEAYYLSDRLSRLWGKGFILVTELTQYNCSYVASYVNKQRSPKQIKLAQGSPELLAKFDAKFNTTEAVDLAQDLGQLPSSFLLMSRRPGIAHDFFTKEQKGRYYKYDGLTTLRGKRLPKRVFRYYDNLLERDYYVCLQVMKDKRKMLSKELRLQFDGDRWRARLQRREDVLAEKQKHKKKRDF